MADVQNALPFKQFHTLLESQGWSDGWPPHYNADAIRVDRNLASVDTCHTCQSRSMVFQPMRRYLVRTGQEQKPIKARGGFWQYRPFVVCERCQGWYEMGGR